MNQHESFFRDMKRMWIETFGDSAEYVDLLYSTYYNDNSSYFIGLYEGDVLVSSLVGIGYNYKDSVSGDRKRGLYLCGLATHPRFRGKGIMKDLMRRVEDRAFKDGYNFTFLIPADDRLRKYYSLMGYKSIMKQGILKINSVCENRKFLTNDAVDPKFSILANETEFEEKVEIIKYKNIDEEKFESIYRLLKKNEEDFPGTAIIHTKEDLKGILKENELSGGRIILVKHNALAIEAENKIKGLFCSHPETLSSFLKYLHKEGIDDIVIPQASPIWNMLDATYSQLEDYVMVKTNTYSDNKLINLPFSAYLLLD